LSLPLRFANEPPFGSPGVPPPPSWKVARKGSCLESAGALAMHDVDPLLAQVAGVPLPPSVITSLSNLSLPPQKLTASDEQQGVWGGASEFFFRRNNNNNNILPPEKMRCKEDFFIKQNTSRSDFPSALFAVQQRAGSADAAAGQHPGRRGAPGRGGRPPHGVSRRPTHRPRLARGVGPSLHSVLRAPNPALGGARGLPNRGWGYYFRI